MKKQIIAASIGIMSIFGVLSFSHQQSAITGKVSPADGADMVWAISGMDSAKAPISSGSFSVQVKGGIYKVIIDAKEPYKDVLIENVDVKDGQPVNMGEIMLQK